MAAQESLTSLTIKSTEASTFLRASIESMHRDLSEHRGESKTQSANVGAKLDNIDRSLGELKILLERMETMRHDELKRIFELLTEERGERRRAVESQVEASKDDDVRAVFKQLLSEERGERREELQREIARKEDNRNLLKEVAKAVWQKGGQWVVFASCVLLVLFFQKCSGVDVLSILTK